MPVNLISVYNEPPMIFHNYEKTVQFTFEMSPVMKIQEE